MTVRVTSWKLCIPLSLFLVLRFPLFVTCSKVLRTGLRVSVRSQCGSLWMLNVQQTVQVVAAWQNAHFAVATGYRVILRLRFSLWCLFEELPAWCISWQCTDEHICFAMYFMIDVMDVWWTKQVDVWPLDENGLVYGNKNTKVVLLCIPFEKRQNSVNRRNSHPYTAWFLAVSCFWNQFSLCCYALEPKYP
jgi:hypothetical protein